MARLTRRSLLAGAAGAAPALGLQADPRTPAGPPAGKLNLIQIVVDTWGADWLGCYGAQHVRTPGVDALARKSAVFDDAYPEALPTLPCRRAIYTGRRIFPSERVLQRDDLVKIRGWHQLFAEDVTLSETLHDAGYTTALITDVYHQFKPDKNYHRGFDSWRHIRGQEGDRLECGPRKAIDLARYMHPSQPVPRHAKTVVMQYLLNRREWGSQEDWLAAQVFREAARWLDSSAGDEQPFYLHIESFSPHEFWDPPEEYYRSYMKSDYRGPRLISPPLTVEKMSAVEVEHVRALYAGYVSFVDARIGRFLEKVEQLGLLRNSVIVFTADHGTMMGEQGQLHKGEQRLRTQVTRVPLMFYHPREPWAGRRLRGFVQHTDIMPTLAGMLGVPGPARVTGESLLPLIESGAHSRRDTIVTGWGEHAAIRTPEWCYIGRWSRGPAFEQLYDVRRDALELQDVAAQHPAALKQLRAELNNYVASGWPITRGTFAKVLPA